MYSTRFKTVYPYEERNVGRPVRTTPAYAEYRQRNAVFGASDGMEFPLCFAPEGSPAADTLTFKRPNWFSTVAQECKALATGVGIIDITTYGKHIVSGPGAFAWLEKVMANTMPTKDGTLKLTPMLSEAGKLIGEFSVARLGSDEYLLIGSGVVDRFHHRWWEQFLPAEGVTVESMTAKLAGYSVSGPNARELIARLAHGDVSKEAWPYGKVGRIEIGPASDAILVRVAYTGELGYEIWVPMESQVALLQALLREGENLGVKLAGIRALNSLRVEKGYGAWGLEYSIDYSPFDASMGHLVKFEKPEFIGRDAALKLKQLPRKYTYAFFEIDAKDADPWGGEPILNGEEVVGFITSAAFGHRTGKSLGLGYMFGEPTANLENLSTEILGESCKVRILPKAAYDPLSSKMKG